MKHILFCLLFPFIIYGQLNQNTLLPNALPQNPQVNQFMNYGETPLNSYTGSPEINIPVYTIEAKGLNIPIVLNYISNGNKVNKESSWIGLGWDLSTDYQIVQTVNGFDDFGYYRRHLFPDLNCLIPLQSGGLSANNVLGSCGGFFLSHDDNSIIGPNSNCTIMPQYTGGLWDSEPDVFYFNAVGYSGKFILDWANEKFVCLTDKNIKIESSDYESNFSNSSDGIASSFIITVPDGHAFFFELKEDTKINVSASVEEFGGAVPMNAQLAGKTSSRVYKLVQIITNKSDVVLLDYEKASNIINGTIKDAVSKNFPTINCKQTTYSAFPGSKFTPSNNGNTTSYLATEQIYSYLKRIKHLGGETVDFITSAREDIKEARKLDKIVVSYRANSKTFIFNYDYFTANSLGNNWDSFLGWYNYNCEKTANEISKRLKLNSFQMENDNPYIFEYNSQSLPKKTSYATDYWGFYNGINTNNSFFPNIYMFNIERDSPYYSRYQDNNKSAVLEYCKAGVLEKIKYPTGGYTFYNYELNSFNNYVIPSMTQGSLESIDITTIPYSISGKKSSKAVLIEGGNTIFSGSAKLYIKGCTSQYPPAYSDCYVRIIHFKKEFIPIVKAVPGYITYGLQYALATIQNSNPTLYNQNIDSDSRVLFKVANGIDDENFSNLEYNLKEGIAYFIVSGGCGTFTYGSTSNTIVNTSQASLSLTFKDYKPLESVESFGGGLRIKSITNFSNTNILAHRKEFQYEGGKLMTPPIYFNKTLQNLTRQNIYGISGNCAENSSIILNNSELAMAWSRFSSNPTGSNASYVNSSIQRVNQEVEMASCDGGIISEIVMFSGYKNEISANGYVQSSNGASGKYVGYDKVTEEDIDNKYVSGTNKPTNGKTVNYFRNNPDGGVPNIIGNGYWTEINLPPTIQYPENGLLEKQEIYDSENVLKREITNFYVSRMEPCFWAMKNIRTDYFAQLIPFSNGLCDNKNKYLDGFYPIKAGQTILESKRIKYFEDESELLILNTYGYDVKNQLSTIEEKRSNGDTVFTNNFYPYDFPNEYSGLIFRNMIAPIVKTYKQINRTPMSLEKSLYKYISGSTVDNVYFPSKYLIDKIQFAKSGIDSDLEDQVIFHNYDIYGNPTEVSKKDGSSVCYLWGYKGQYPIAKIENATYISITSSLITAAQTESDTGTESSLLTALTALRTAFPNAMVTTYTYKPLIGVSTITDPKGDKITYEYDEVNRLKFVKDNNGNILSENEYHYKN